MPNCAVFSCLNHNKKTQGTDIKYFRFPKQPDLVNRWISACCRDDAINVKHARICSKHFEDGCFEVPLKQKLLNYQPRNARHLKSDAVPTININEGKTQDSLCIQNKWESFKQSDFVQQWITNVNNVRINIPRKRRRKEVDVDFSEIKVEPALSDDVATNCPRENYNSEIDVVIKQEKIDDNEVIQRLQEPEIKKEPIEGRSTGQQTRTEFCDNSPPVTSFPWDELNALRDENKKLKAENTKLKKLLKNDRIK